jgi:hypothetical protein
LLAEATAPRVPVVQDEAPIETDSVYIAVPIRALRFVRLVDSDGALQGILGLGRPR